MACADLRTKRLVTLLLIVIVGIAVSCTPRLMVREGWSEERFGPLVPHETFPSDCSLCHVPDRWDVLREDFAFNHGKETGYPLEGAHASAQCLRCHNDRGAISAYVSRGCSGCHVDPHQTNLGSDCSRCHDQLTWQPGGLIAEHATARFPLEGAHVAVSCEACHQRQAAGEFRGVPASCHQCHQDELARSSQLDHLASGFTSGCDECHTPNAWEDARFPHDFFPLSGGHAAVSCRECHTTGVLGPISSDCASCHESELVTASLDHAAAGFSRQCQECHSTSGWRGAQFGHDRFPLAGGHAGLSCAQCHGSGTPTAIASDCASCHLVDRQRAQPDHSSFSLNCTQCHSTASWAGAAFGHDRFPLVGGHSGLSCTQCHGSGTPTTIASDCVSCHQGDYQQAPQHVAAGLSQNCQDCHGTSSWNPVGFSHRFPLQGPHRRSCSSCHLGTTQTFSCAGTCHEHSRSKMDREHRGRRNYRYEFSACYSCHPDGDD